jgi:phosphoribosylanthranilate isomerase
MILKVCGITCQEDADAAVQAGANALGFNFYPHSPRYVAPEGAAGIETTALRVGVFVNETADQLRRIVRIARLDIAQLHGQETPADYPDFIGVWKAARIGAGFDLASLDESPADALVLDGPASGETFAWELARGARHRVILAGGLDAQNVRQAVSVVHPWGVDICSRIESVPGRKDHKKMSEFLKAAQEALAA